jgi:hypothetical protein
VASEAVFVTARSADAVTAVVTLAELLAVLGSGSVAVTDAVLVMLPAATGLMMMVTVAVAALARVPRLQLTAAVQVPWLGVAETNVTPVGTASVKVTPVAGDGPLLVTIRVYVRLLPIPTGLGEAVLVTARSAEDVAVTLVEAVLFAVLGSNSFNVTVAVFVDVPGAVAVTIILTVAVAALASEPRLQVTVVVPVQVP